MRDAVAEDFQRVPGITVVLSNYADAKPPDREPDFTALARQCDFTLLIAPETNGELAKRCGWALGTRTRLLGPDFRGLHMPTHKQYLADWWMKQGVPTPLTTAATSWPEGRYPAVVKPIDGAGSMNTTLVRNREELHAALTQAEAGEFPTERMISQSYVPGRAASVAFLVSPTQTVPLTPTFQLLSSDGRFHYEGGELPIPPHLAERALKLGLRAISCVPGLRGYIGVDLVLGEAMDGSEDYAIEINPRLTTSYIGLRQLADFNLANALLQVMQDEPVSPRWKEGIVRFWPNGSVSIDPTTG